MRAFILQIFVVCCAAILTVYSFETPSLEVNVVITTTANVNETYFENEVKDFLIRLTQVLDYPEDVSDHYPEFARMTVNVGGNDGSFTFNPLQNMSRQQTTDQIRNLTMRVGNLTREGSIDALNHAYEMYTWLSSVTAVFDRFTIVLTDELLKSDIESDVARLLDVMSKNIIIIGIPSEANPTFKNSMEAAENQTTQAFSSIEAADEVIDFINISMHKPRRACRGIIFAYEASNYINISTQQNFVRFARLAQISFDPTDAIAMVSFDDLITYNFAFLYFNKYGHWKTPTSNEFNPDVYYRLPTVYSNLQRIVEMTALPYVTIVILTQTDHYLDNDQVSIAMGILGDEKNADVFVYNAGDDNPVDYLYLTNNHPERIFDVRNFDYNAMLTTYSNNIYPIVQDHSLCGKVPSSTTTPTSASPTQEIETTTYGAGSSYFTSVTVAMGIAFFNFAL
uniref:VWFA domain-containing protein n=1 Tax=Panagrellus redivivus TaxID=6233 RepID=A0A7E4WC42_PANRE